MQHTNWAIAGFMVIHFDFNFDPRSHELGMPVNVSNHASMPRHVVNIKLPGTPINKLEHGFSMHQAEYVNSIKPLERNFTYKISISRRYELAWIFHNRPVVITVATMLSSGTKNTFASNHISHLNMTFSLINTELHLGPTQLNLNADSLRFVAILHASFATLPDFSSQLWYVLFPLNQTKRVNRIHYSSFKCRPDIRSVPGSKNYAFAHTHTQIMSSVIKQDF